MRIALAQLNYIVGDVEGNAERIINTINSAKDQQVDIVVFAELALCGYPALDLLTYPSFIDRCEKELARIASHCTGIASVVGAPTRNSDKRGKPLYNSACFLADGGLLFTQHKALLPDYDVFDEYRYFEPFEKPKILQYKDHKIAIAICEDIWEVGEVGLYDHLPLEELSKFKPDFLINIAASPFNTNQAEIRKEVVQKNATTYNLPIYYVNHVGAQTELVFDGGSLYCNAQGEIKQEMPYFHEEVRIIDTESTSLQAEQSKMQRIEEALILGVRDFFRKQGFTKAILGLSGGIDSALTAAIACKALGAANVLGVLMPSPYSSDHSIQDAEDLASNLGCASFRLPIEKPFTAFLETLAKPFEGTASGIAEENLQARIRGTLLMGISNKLGYILLNTTNKSEAAVGYGTLYGDLCGGLSVLADVYKTEIFELCKWINKEQEIIPHNTLVKPPSAELRPDQKDSDSLPEYPILDAILYRFIEGVESKTQIIDAGFDADVVNKVIKLVNQNEYKRWQTAPILRVSKKAFGNGRAMPLVGKLV